MTPLDAQRERAAAPVPSLPRCPACGSKACPGTRATCSELRR